MASAQRLVGNSILASVYVQQSPVEDSSLFLRYPYQQVSNTVKPLQASAKISLLWYGGEWGIRKALRVRLRTQSPSLTSGKPVAEDNARRYCIQPY